MNWADNLIAEYSKGRKEIKVMTDKLGEAETDRIDKTLLNGMYEDMTFVIEWLETGRQPGTFRGADVRSIYQIQYIEEMDLIPDITEQLYGEREELQELEEYQKEVLHTLLEELSGREKQCFILHVGDRRSMSEVAKMLGISKSSVQEYLNRTRIKVDSVIRSHTKSV